MKILQMFQYNFQQEFDLVRQGRQTHDLKLSMAIETLDWHNLGWRAFKNSIPVDNLALGHFL